MANSMLLGAVNPTLPDPTRQQDTTLLGLPGS